jgi:Holliday junction DNA helicase RuvA
LVDCHGVGYEVQVSMTTFYDLPALGAPVTLLTHFVVREDAQQLFGFGVAAEREAFRQLDLLLAASTTGSGEAASAAGGPDAADAAAY